MAVNLAGFLLVAMHTRFPSRAADDPMDPVLAILSLIGGSLGVVTAILLMDRRVEKKNIMSRVFILCVCVIQLILFLIVRGHLRSDITFNFLEFFCQHKGFTGYLLVVNVVTFLAFGLDKIAAIEHKFRIKIVTLLGLAFLGGSIGGLMGMYMFRHKTKKDYFTIGIPLILVMQAAVIFFLMNGDFSSKR